MQYPPVNFASLRLCVKTNRQRYMEPMFTQRRKENRTQDEPLLRRVFSWPLRRGCGILSEPICKEHYVNETLNDTKIFNAGGTDLEA